MKTNILLSILFLIVTTFTAVHEVEHIVHDEVECLISHVNNNEIPDDFITTNTLAEFVCCNKTSYITLPASVYSKYKSNSPRAPPIFS